MKKIKPSIDITIPNPVWLREKEEKAKAKLNTTPTNSPTETKYKPGDILKVDLGMQMDSTVKDSNIMYLKVYDYEGTLMVTAVKGWVPCGYSDWSLSGTLGNGANKKISLYKGKL